MGFRGSGEIILGVRSVIEAPVVTDLVWPILIWGELLLVWWVSSGLEWASPVVGFDDEEGRDGRNFRLNLCLQGRDEEEFYRVNLVRRV